MRILMATLLTVTLFLSLVACAAGEDGLRGEPPRAAGLYRGNGPRGLSRACRRARADRSGGGHGTGRASRSRGRHWKGGDG